MSIVLYREGSSATIRGVRCEFKIYPSNSFEHLLEQGWFLSPEEIKLAEEKKAEEKKQIIDRLEKATKKDKPKEKKPEEDKAGDQKAKIIEGLKAKKAELIAEQNKE